MPAAAFGERCGRDITGANERLPSDGEVRVTRRPWSRTTERAPGPQRACALIELPDGSSEEVLATRIRPEGM